VEHPELVAQRIENYVDPRVAWAKLRALTEGAALAKP